MLGLSLARYNDYPSNIDPATKTYEMDESQHDLDTKLKRLNQEIYALNSSGNLRSPEFDGRLFNYYGPIRGVRCNYSLFFDGIHQDTVMNAEILKWLLECRNRPLLKKPKVNN